MILRTRELQSLEQNHAFLVGTEALNVGRPPCRQAYELISETLRRLGYARLARADKAPDTTYDALHQLRELLIARVPNTPYSALL
ncbi:MAG: hypothetical protein L0H63_05820 [Nitrococcus sp.]|nr:hypothetical protein [Nitrococcus sp.]